MQDAALPTTAPPVPLGQLISAARRRIKQALWAHVAEDGLTPQQYWMLLVLIEEGPRSLHDLAVRVWIDDPTACRIVKALTARKLVASEPDPDHGRRIRIRMAPGTEALQRRLRAVATKIRGAIEQGLGAEEKARFRASLMKVMSNMDALEAELPYAPRARRAKRD